jgi:hypothetical protein
VNENTSAGIPATSPAVATTYTLTARDLDGRRDTIVIDRSLTSDPKVKEALWRAAEQLERARKILAGIERKAAKPAIQP